VTKASGQNFLKLRARQTIARARATLNRFDEADNMRRRAAMSRYTALNSAKAAYDWERATKVERMRPVEKHHWLLTGRRIEAELLRLARSAKDA
jgi:hypothetical protein